MSKELCAVRGCSNFALSETGLCLEHEILFLQESKSLFFKCKIRTTGGSFAITLPTRMARERGFKKGDQVHVVLIKK
jgi:hypothetical protein